MNEGKLANGFKMGSLPYIMFPEDNEITFFQDMAYWQNIPHDVRFYPRSDNGRSICFIGNGHGIGIKNEYGLHGTYGNGAIYVNKKDIPDGILQFCMVNLLNSEQNDERSVASKADSSTDAGKQKT